MRFAYERPSSGRRCDQYTVFCGSKLVHPSIQFSPVPKAPAKPLPEASKPEGTVYEAFTAALPAPGRGSKPERVLTGCASPTPSIAS